MVWGKQTKDTPCKSKKIHKTKTYYLETSVVGWYLPPNNGPDAAPFTPPFKRRRQSVTESSMVDIMFKFYDIIGWEGRDRIFELLEDKGYACENFEADNLRSGQQKCVSKIC